MASFNELTMGPVPDHAALAAARWRLSNASFHRRTLSARIIQFLGRRTEIGASEAICAMRSADGQMMQRSAEHVRDWTVQAITGDWEGYCRASREIRAHMTNYLSLEREVMFPLLQRLAGRSA